MMMVARVLTIDMHAASTSVEADLSLSCLSLKVHKQYFTMDPARIMEIFIYRGSLFNFVGPGFQFSLSTYGSSDAKNGLRSFQKLSWHGRGVLSSQNYVVQSYPH